MHGVNMGYSTFRPVCIEKLTFLLLSGVKPRPRVRIASLLSSDQALDRCVDVGGIVARSTLDRPC
jgi:hypothetical protein